MDIRIKAGSCAAVAKALKANSGRGLTRVHHFLEVSTLGQDGYLRFRAKAPNFSPYSPDEDGTVPVLSGAWYEAEHIAKWLRKYVEKGGRIVLFSDEADGLAFGWEFDGRGRMRELALVPIGKWS